MTQPTLPHGRYERFESTREYESMLDELIPNTQRVIRIFDRALSPGFSSAARCERLRNFLRSDPHHRLYIVLHDVEPIERSYPRFVELVQHFNHAAKIRETPREAKHLYDAFVVFDASHYLHRFHHAHLRYGRGLDDVEGAQQLLERFEELWEASAAYSPASTSGL